MYKKMFIGFSLFWFSFVVFSDDLELRAGHPKTYVVRKGDTLWDISGKFLKKPWLWPEIWHANKQIQNPHLIYPGDVLSLAFVDGKPYLSLQRGRYLKLQPKVREIPHDEAIPPIPLDAIAPFLSRPQVISPQDLRTAAYVVSSEEEHLVAGAGNTIYIRNLPQPPADKFTIFRTGEIYRDPGAPERGVLGYEALHVGDAILTRNGDPGTAVVEVSKREVLVGDRLLPQIEEIAPEFFPRAPEHEVVGKIISVVDGVTQVGQYQVAVLNLGERQGLEPGHVLAIHQSGRIVRDKVGNEIKRGALDARNTGSGAGTLVELPAERIGELMVFRTFADVSYALVMRIERPAHILDAVRNP